MALIQLDIKRCNNGCPHCKSYRTLGAGCATDYHCSIVPHIHRVTDNDTTRTDVGRMVSSYVEWDSDYNDVPEWCPLLIAKSSLVETENCYACGNQLRGNKLKYALRDERDRPFCDHQCVKEHRARFDDRG